MKACSYEMLIGIPPFYDKNQNKMFSDIEKGPIRWPNETKHGVRVSPEAQDLIFKVRFQLIKFLIAPREEQTHEVGSTERRRGSTFSPILCNY